MKILIVSPYFLPYLGVGALRMSSFAKYLVEQNDDVTVMKLSDNNYQKEMCGTQTVDGIKYVKVDFNGKAKYLESVDVFYTALDELLSQNTFDIILCSCGPFYTMTAVEKISQKYSVPFALDYRDLWIYDDREVSGILNNLRHKLFKIRYKKFEKSAVQKADIFVTVTPLCLDVMKEKYSLQNGHIIYNGYDENAVKDINIASKGQTDNIEICVFGKLSYYSYSLGTLFLTAVKSLIDDGYKLSVKHISETENSTQSILNQINFPKQNYVCTGRKSYNEGMRILADSDICAAVISYKRGLGTKIFDYIFVNKPIVAMAPKNGDFDRLLKKFENAYVCQNEQDMKQSVKNILDNSVRVLDDDIKPGIYSREYQNEKYRELIIDYLSANKLV